MSFHPPFYYYCYSHVNCDYFYIYYLKSTAKKNNNHRSTIVVHTLMTLPDASHSQKTYRLNEEDSTLPVYLRAQQWKKFLLQRSAAFSALEKERERGWRSTALDQWYTKRWSNNQNNNRSGFDITSNEEPQETQAPSHPCQCTEANASTTVSHTHFAGVDIPQLTARYSQHAQRSWASGSAFFSEPASKRCRGGENAHEVFSTHDLQQRSAVETGEIFENLTNKKNVTEALCRVSQSDLEEALPSVLKTRARCFLDLGAAPGGVSSFLSRDRGWSGAAVTLAPTEGGIALHSPLHAAHEETVRRALHSGSVFATSSVPCSVSLKAPYLLYYGDVTKPEETWKLCCEDTTENNVNVSFAFPRHSFDFVNGGAVQDYGQRQQAHREDEREEMAKERSATDSRSSTAEEGSIHKTASAVLPWFTLLVPQLRVGWRYVRSKGALLLVHGAPHCASFFILLHLLRLCWGPSVRLRVYETMHLGKTPVYILCENICVPNQEKDHFTETLFDALDPEGETICPAFAIPSSASSSSSETGSQTHRERKQAFWLGESAEGFQLACAGFHTFRRDVERVWGKMTAFLERRRVRAEEEMAKLRAQSMKEPASP